MLFSVKKLARSILKADLYNEVDESLFSLVIADKDLNPVTSKPHPVSGSNRLNYCPVQRFERSCLCPILEIDGKY
jgi:hypothetical protein